MLRVLTLLMTGALISAAPADVPIGTFQTWLSFKKVPLVFVSGGVSIRVEAVPCPDHPIGDSSCRWDGYNNQAKVTVRSQGMDTMSIATDSQSEYARIAVVRFQRDDARPGIIIESQSGGSGGDMTAQVLIPEGRRYRVLPLNGPGWRYLQGQVADGPRDLSGDGIVDLQFEDGRFDSVFGCNACTPRPPLLFAIRNGEVVDESTDPALRGIFKAEMRRLAPRCFSHVRYRNGTCAAYVADAARAGMFDMAWAAMLRHYEQGADLWQPCDVPASQWTDHRCPVGHGARYKDFPESLRAFLTKVGYLPA